MTKEILGKGAGAVLGPGTRNPDVSNVMRNPTTGEDEFTPAWTSAGDLGGRVVHAGSINGLGEEPNIPRRRVYPIEPAPVELRNVSGGEDGVISQAPGSGRWRGIRLNRNIALAIGGAAAMLGTFAILPPNDTFPQIPNITSTGKSSGERIDLPQVRVPVQVSETPAPTAVKTEVAQTQAPTKSATSEPTIIRLPSVGVSGPSEKPQTVTPTPVVSQTETVRPTVVSTEPTHTPKKEKITVGRGDYLLKIARQLLVKAGLYKPEEKIPYSVNAAVALEIAGENENIADHPNLIYPGQELDVPSERALQKMNDTIGNKPEAMNPNYDWTTPQKARKDEKNVEEFISQAP